MQCFWDCQRAILGWFYKYGFFLSKHPYCFLVIPFVVCGLLALGFLKYEPLDDIEYLYTPSESRAISDREVVQRTFPDQSDVNYSPFSLNTLNKEAEIIFRSKKRKSIITEEVMQELEPFYKSLIGITVKDRGEVITFDDVCKRRNGSCVIYGSFFFDASFRDKIKAQKVTYPQWNEQPGVDMTSIFAMVDLTFEGVLLSAGALKIALPVKDGWQALSWEAEFIRRMGATRLTTVEIAYSTSFSMSEELNKGTNADIHFFALTFTLMIVYSAIVSSGGDCVSSRILLSGAGVLAVLFGIVGAFGLVCLCGVNYVSIVGTMPFLTLGIGVDDMFLLMSSWSETLSMTDLSLSERLGTVYQKAGIGITITSVTDTLAFAIGASSNFRSVRNFSIYTGVGVVLCYFCNACIFGACLTLHGRRVYSSRHLLTCRPVQKSRSELKEDGQNLCRVYLCGGQVPSNPEDDQSWLERGPTRILVRVLLWNPVRYLVLVFFAGYLAVSIWGCTKLQQGLDLKNLAPLASYYHKYQEWDDKDFGVKLPISFVTVSTKDYMDNQTLKEIKDVLTKAQEDPQIVEQVTICWYTMFVDSPWFDNSGPDQFYEGLQHFLVEQPHFYNDIVFGSDNRSITASRCHVYSYKVTDSTEQANLMTRMRDVADASPAGVFAYHPAFVFFEQFAVILTSTLQTVGVTIAVMFFATCIFLPHPLMVVLVTAQVFMIVIGIFGFMAHWHLTLSSITMIELIMSVGFSVDFCAHVCTAYMVSTQHSREDRARDAIIHASSPILNGGFSSIIGIIMLVFTESYIFQSFFKIMLLVIGFGVLHAVFLVPVVLSFIGPSSHIVLEPLHPPELNKQLVLTSADPTSQKEHDAGLDNEASRDNDDEIGLDKDGLNTSREAVIPPKKDRSKRDSTSYVNPTFFSEDSVFSIRL